MSKQVTEIDRVYKQLSTPFFVLLGFSFLAISGLVIFVTHIQNQNSVEASVHLAETVIDANEHTLGMTAFDNGYWDVVVENMVTQVNPDWADENIGGYLFKSANISSTYVLDGENAHVYSSISGKRLKDDPLVRFSSGLDILIKRARDGDPTAEPATVTGFIRDQEAVHFAAVVLMTSYTKKDGIETNYASNSVLILTRKIDQGFLERQAANYSLPGLKFIPSEGLITGATLPLTTKEGFRVGTLSWQPRLPGDEVLPTLLIAIFVAFALMGIMTYFFLSRTRALAVQLSEAKAEADYANLAKSDFLANMSHELRTPLNAVLGFCGIIRAETYGPLQNDKYQEFIEDIEGAGEHLLELINEVLDLATIEAGRTELQMEEINLGETIRSATKYVNNWAVEKGISLNVELEQVDPIITADLTAVRQIVLNLVSNAVKFTPKNGEVSCLCSLSSDGRAIIKVIDNGIGIEQSDIQKVMEPFGQVVSADKRDHKGSGLGLPITKKLTELLGGTFLLESKFGVGTQVTVSFPAQIKI